MVPAALSEGPPRVSSGPDAAPAHCCLAAPTPLPAESAQARARAQPRAPAGPSDPARGVFSPRRRLSLSEATRVRLAFPSDVPARAREWSFFGGAVFPALTAVKPHLLRRILRRERGGREEPALCRAARPAAWARAGFLGPRGLWPRCDAPPRRDEVGTLFACGESFSPRGAVSAECSQ